MKQAKDGIYNRIVKRFFDIVISSVVLLLLSWLYLILAILVKTKLGSPIIFAQDRPGKNEKIFKLYKFRTMLDAVDKDGNPLPDEERLTPFGKKLRSTSLDELPEFWNILKGDMSIVGPRPLLVRYLERYNEEQHHRHDVRPGLTGYAQSHGRNTVSWEDKFAMDVWYSKNITFKLDVQIIIDTVKTVLLHEGISSETSATMEEFIGTPEGVKPSWEAPF